MEEMSEQTVERAASAEPLDENLAEADGEDASHPIENILETDITVAEDSGDHSAETKIEINEAILSATQSDAVVDDPNVVQEKITEASKSNKDSTELKLDGIEGKEDPVEQPVQLELLSQQKPLSSFISGEIIAEEDEDEQEYSIQMSVPDDRDYFDDEEKDEDQLIDTASPEYQVYDREILLQQYKESVEERGKIQNQNQQLQHKLAEYFKKKKTDDRGQEIEKNVNDQEQRYLKYMSNLEELQKVEDRQGANIEIQLEDMHRKCTEMQNKVEEASNEFIKFKYEVAADAINSRSGKHIPAKDLDQYRTSEAKKEQEVIAVRLENIKLKNRLKKREQQLKAKEELAEGLHLIDFEQLKIENQTYHEKIEERNEELLKLRKKITTTVQVLTHLKEKLQFVQGENGEQRAKLRDIEVTVAQRRDILTRLKQVRDALRIDNNKLKHKAGLLGNKPLLKDYEIRKDEGEELYTKLESLKSQHVDLNLTLQGVKKKIEKSKPAQPI